MLTLNTSNQVNSTDILLRLLDNCFYISRHDNPYSAVIDFRRQNLTSVNVRF